MLAVAGAVTGCVGVRAVGELSWGVFPFVVGLFIAVHGLENLGIVLALARGAGVDVQTRRFVMLGLWMAPLIVVATTIALTLSPR